MIVVLFLLHIISGVFPLSFNNDVIVLLCVAGVHIGEQCERQRAPERAAGLLPSCAWELPRQHPRTATHCQWRRSRPTARALLPHHRRQSRELLHHGLHHRSVTLSFISFRSCCILEVSFCDALILCCTVCHLVPQNTLNENVCLNEIFCRIIARVKLLLKKEMTS